MFIFTEYYQLVKTVRGEGGWGWMKEGKGINQTNKQTYIYTDTHNSVVLARGERGRAVSGSGEKWGKGDAKRLCLGRWTHHTVCRSCFVELYT